MRRFALLAILLALLPTARSLAAERPRVAVMKIRVEKGIDPSTVRILDELLLTRINERALFSAVIGEQDIIDMIQLEEERAKLTGCVDENCLAEIGGALGVDYIFSSSVGRVGENNVVNAKLLNVRKALVAGRESVVVKPTEDALIESMKGLVDRVCLQAFPGEDRTQVGFAWATAGLALASVVAGAAVGGLALKDQDTLEGMEKYDTGRDALRDDLRTKGLVADVMFGVAAAAAVASLLLFVLDDDEEQAEASAGVLPLSGGAAVSLGMRF